MQTIDAMARLVCYGTTVDSTSAIIAIIRDRELSILRTTLEVSRRAVYDVLFSLGFNIACCTSNTFNRRVVGEHSAKTLHTTEAHNSTPLIISCMFSLV